MNKNTLSSLSEGVLVTQELSVPISTENLKLEVLKEAIKLKENEVLLSLSNAIATIRNKNDLFDVITNDLKSIFPFSDFVICMVNDDKETHSPFLFNENEVFQNGSGLAPRSDAKYPLDDGLCSIMLKKEEPIVFDVDDLIKQPYCPPWLAFWHKRGVKEMISFCIKNREDYTVFFYLYMNEKNTISNIYYNLFKKHWSPDLCCYS